MNFIDQFKERFAFRIRDIGEGVPHDPLQPDAGLATAVCLPDWAGAF
jgi:hypothetical protein